MSEYPILTDEEFKRIYADKKFRNNVAYAHGCCNNNGIELYRKAFDYPRAFAVSHEQIKEAKAEKERAAAATLEANKGKLLLVGMGWPDCDTAQGTDVKNTRVRGVFRDKAGTKCFIEANHANNHKTGASYLWFDFAFYGDDCNTPRVIPQDNRGPYTKANILRQVNHHFGTTFKEIVIDNYDLEPSSYESIETD